MLLSGYENALICRPKTDLMKAVQKFIRLCDFVLDEIFSTQRLTFTPIIEASAKFLRNSINFSARIREFAGNFVYHFHALISQHAHALKNPRILSEELALSNFVQLILRII